MKMVPPVPPTRNAGSADDFAYSGGPDGATRKTFADAVTAAVEGPPHSSSVKEKHKSKGKKKHGTEDKDENLPATHKHKGKRKHKDAPPEKVEERKAPTDNNQSEQSISAGVDKDEEEVDYEPILPAVVAVATPGGDVATPVVPGGAAVMGVREEPPQKMEQVLSNLAHNPTLDVTVAPMTSAWGHVRVEHGASNKTEQKPSKEDVVPAQKPPATEDKGKSKHKHKRKRKHNASDEGEREKNKGKSKSKSKVETKDKEKEKEKSKTAAPSVPNTQAKISFPTTTREEAGAKAEALWRAFATTSENLDEPVAPKKQKSKKPKRSKFIEYDAEVSGEEGEGEGDEEGEGEGEGDTDDTETVRRKEEEALELRKDLDFLDDSGVVEEYRPLDSRIIKNLGARLRKDGGRKKRKRSNRIVDSNSDGDKDNAEEDHGFVSVGSRSSGSRGKRTKSSGRRRDRRPSAPDRGPREPPRKIARVDIRELEAMNEGIRSLSHGAVAGMPTTQFLRTLANSVKNMYTLSVQIALCCAPAMEVLDGAVDRYERQLEEHRRQQQKQTDADPTLNNANANSNPAPGLGTKADLIG